MSMASCSAADSGWPGPWAERGELDFDRDRDFSSDDLDGAAFEGLLAEEALMDAVATEMAESFGLAMTEGVGEAC
jgi:hypothetical protein